VLDLVGEVGEYLAPDPRGPERAHDGLDPETLRVLEALPGRRYRDLDALTATAGLDIRTVTRCLGLLSDLGLVESGGAGWRLAARRPDGA
jgi:DNA processing protein